MSLWVYYHTVLSQQVMSPTPPARVIVTVFYQPTLLHVRVLVTQLGARVPCKCAALPTERECCFCSELAHIRHLFSDVEGLQCITDHPKFVGACPNLLTLRIALVGVMATRGDPIQLPIPNR